MLVYDDLKLSDKLSVYDKSVEVVEGKDIYDETYCVRTKEFGTYCPYIENQDALYNSINRGLKCPNDNS